MTAVCVRYSKIKHASDSYANRMFENDNSNLNFSQHSLVFGLQALGFFQRLPEQRELRT